MLTESFLVDTKEFVHVCLMSYTIFTWSFYLSKECYVNERDIIQKVLIQTAQFSKAQGEREKVYRGVQQLHCNM